ncbi:sugar-specific transcriptional regulator TrmB [Caulobacter ginsengisoli]|uniref:Sugar-specific transcriptional regulator TrmB n=1 Tax=Caulobacter ginsengisoli TaxID=400775 RepID=A0ABU0IJU6_9CAUL|nr:helix-turn-helix domain-containing protein [Caulobacter ginsengisoli]MDQ0462282.1 sugar-specific transcriptional regulator TrmB [Caulobacter ginsengisoli]
MTTNNETPERLLAELGFTDTESRLYCELARGGPATGYRLARAIGKAPANVYQALESLSHKGAVQVDETEAKAWRAAPAAELVAALKAGYERRSGAALAALSAIRPPEPDARLYNLKTPEQVLARARAMIAAAREVVLFDLFPQPLEALKPDLERAAAAGIIVAGLTYAPTSASFRTTQGAAAEQVAQRWPGQQVTVVADAREHLVALLSPDGGRVIQGVSSDSPYLACLQHSGLSAELRLNARGGDDPWSDLSLLTLRPSGLTTLIGDPE